MRENEEFLHVSGYVVSFAAVRVIRVVTRHATLLE